MKLSAPIYRLKHRARVRSREERIPLHEALDRIAREEGYGTWSLLAARAPDRSPARVLLAELAPGDLLLLGARPGQGKTMFSLELAVEAMRAGRQSVFFTLEYNAADIATCFSSIGESLASWTDRFQFDDSDDISAAYVIERLQTAPPGTVVVVDYLQSLDQRREHPDLAVQVSSLRAFARERGLIMVFIAQIDRRFDPTRKSVPGRPDVRLPNPLDLGLFGKACFLHDGKVELS